MSARVVRVEPDHFLVDDGNGWLPHMDADLSPEEHAGLMKLCGGGDVPHYAEGVDSVPASDPSGDAVVAQSRPGDGSARDSMGRFYVGGVPWEDVAANKDEYTKNLGEPPAEPTPEPAPAQPTARTTVSPTGQVTIDHFGGAPTPAPANAPAPEPAQMPTLGSVLSEVGGKLVAPIKAGLSQAASIPGDILHAAIPGTAPLGPPIVPSPPVAHALPTSPAPTAQMGSPASAALPEQPPAAPKLGGGPTMADVRKVNDQSAKDRTALAIDEGKLDTEIAGHLEQQTKELRRISSDYNDALAKNAARAMFLQSQDIDPLHMLKEMGPFTSTIALVGLGLGTFGSSLAGSPNAALQMYSDAIERDLKAQERNQQKNITLNDAERARLTDQHNQQKADALSLVSNLIDQSRAKMGPGLALDKAKLESDKAKEASLHLMNEIAGTQNARALQQWQINHQVWLDKQAQKAQADNMATANALVAEGYTPSQAARLNAIVHDPKANLEYGVSYVDEPLKDEKGVPVLDANGAVQYPRPIDHYVQEKEKKGEFLDRAALIHQAQEPIAKLARLVHDHPEGTWSPAEREKAEQYKTEIGTVLTDAATGSKRLSEMDIENARKQAANVSVWGQITGASDVKVDALQQFISGLRRANKQLLFPFPVRKAQ